MYSALQIGCKYIRYYITAANGRGHGVHSPFVFDFITKVLNDDRQFYSYRPIETLRHTLLNDTRTLCIEDMGAGSRTGQSNTRTVAEVAAASLKPVKFSQLLFRIVHYYAPASVMELGTSLGITTCYLATANPAAKVITLEGAEEVAEAAKKNFEELQLNNISTLTGNFDDTLVMAIASIPKLDFVFVDGNHRYEPTMRYFKDMLPKIHADTILIFDDIHWSSEMESAWEDIKRQEEVTLTIDLFFIGIVFFRKEQKEKTHVSVRF